MKFLTSPWMSVPVGAVVYLSATLFFWRTPTPPAKPAPAVAQASATGPSWEFSNPEADQLITELRTEKKTLDKRQQQLNELEARLQSERTELTAVTQSVHQAQMDFDKLVVRVQEEETGNLKRLAKVYAAMSPATAASILSELDDITIGKIMVFMKDAETAGILGAVAQKGPADAKRAAEISERLRLSAYRSAAAK